MSRELPVGDGSLLAWFDQDGSIRDLSFRRVGREAHLGRLFAQMCTEIHQACCEG